MSPKEARENDLATVEQLVERLEELRALLKVYTGARSPLGVHERLNLSLHVDTLNDAVGYLGDLVWVQPPLL